MSCVTGARQLFSKTSIHREEFGGFLDRATYHTILDDEDRKSVTASNKARVIDAIKRCGVVSDD